MNQLYDKSINVVKLNYLWAWQWAECSTLVIKPAALAVGHKCKQAVWNLSCGGSWYFADVFSLHNIL